MTKRGSLNGHFIIKKDNAHDIDILKWSPYQTWMRKIKSGYFGKSNKY